METNNCIIYCNCGAGIISEKKRSLIGNSLKEARLDVIELHDLCAFSVNEKDIFDSIEKQYTKKFIVACYPRAVKNILSQNKINLTNYIVLNFREFSGNEILSRLNKETTEFSEDANWQVQKSVLNVPAWYPVIDEARCTLCGQCAKFCVFGVYKFSKKQLEVLNPLSCKNNCPACGRTCPASAIIFPKLDESTVLSGEEPGKMHISADSSKPEGLYAMLKDRNTARRNIFRDGVMQQAESEKMKAIDEFKKELRKKK